MDKNELEFNKTPFPEYAFYIGWSLTALPLTAIPICAFIQVIKFKDNLVSIYVFSLKLFKLT